MNQGTLSLAHAHSLGANAEVAIAGGAAMELNFTGPMNIRRLTLDGKVQPPGSYAATSAPNFLKGAGVLNVQP